MHVNDVAQDVGDVIDEAHVAPDRGVTGRATVRWISC